MGFPTQPLSPLVPQRHSAFWFGPYRLLPGPRLLFEHTRPVKLGGRAFDVLTTLVERRDRVVSKDELIDLVWPGRVVEENNLQVQVVALRKAIGRNAIATVSGRGYRFALEVRVDRQPRQECAWVHAFVVRIAEQAVVATARVADNDDAFERRR